MSRHYIRIVCISSIQSTKSILFNFIHSFKQVPLIYTSFGDSAAPLCWICVCIVRSANSNIQRDAMRCSSRLMRDASGCRAPRRSAAAAAPSPRSNYMTLRMNLYIYCAKLHQLLGVRFCFYAKSRSIMMMTVRDQCKYTSYTVALHALRDGESVIIINNLSWFKSDRRELNKYS